MSKDNKQIISPLSILALSVATVIIGALTLSGALHPQVSLIGSLGRIGIEGASIMLGTGVLLTIFLIAFQSKPNKVNTKVQASTYLAAQQKRLYQLNK